MESYVIVFIACLLNVRYLDLTGVNNWVTFNSALTLFLLAVYTLFPIIAALYMYIKFNRLGQR